MTSSTYSPPSFIALIAFILKSSWCLSSSSCYFKYSSSASSRFASLSSFFLITPVVTAVRSGPTILDDRLILSSISCSYFLRDSCIWSSFYSKAIKVESSSFAPSFLAPFLSNSVPLTDFLTVFLIPCFDSSIGLEERLFFLPFILSKELSERFELLMPVFPIKAASSSSESSS